MDMKQGKSAMQCVNCPGRDDHDTADCPVMKYGQLDPQQRLDVARGVVDTKDCTRLPVVASAEAVGIVSASIDGECREAGDIQSMAEAICSALGNSGFLRVAPADKNDFGKPLAAVIRRFGLEEDEAQSLAAEMAIALIPHLAQWDEDRSADAQALIAELQHKHAEELARAGEQLMAQARTIQKLQAAPAERGVSAHDVIGVLRAVQEQFNRFAERFPDGFDGRVFRWVDDAVAAYALDPAPATAEQAWIPVSERLPDPDQVVALMNDDVWMNTGADGFDCNWHGAGYLVNSTPRPYWAVFGETRAQCLDAATHWMPLPAAPTQGGDV
jgi:hypothetical protein